MPLTTPVSISQAALIIKGQLDLWAGPKGGTVKILESLAHLWEEVMTVKDQPRILVVCTGEESRGESSIRGHWQRVDRQWKVVVIRGHGWKNLIAEASGNTEPFTDTWEAVRDQVRLILNIGEEWPPIEYLGGEPVPNVGPNQQANVFMSAQQLSFTTANDLKRLTTTPPNTDPG